MHIALLGSGPAGMTAALLLARQGHRITLVDRDPGPVPGQSVEPGRRDAVPPPARLPQPCRGLLEDRLPDVHQQILAAGRR